jgi:hypothetical protein
VCGLKSHHEALLHTYCREVAVLGVVCDTCEEIHGTDDPVSHDVQ